MGRGSWLKFRESHTFLRLQVTSRFPFPYRRRQNCLLETPKLRRSCWKPSGPVVVPPGSAPSLAMAVEAPRLRDASCCCLSWVACSLWGCVFELFGPTHGCTFHPFSNGRCCRHLVPPHAITGGWGLAVGFARCNLPAASADELFCCSLDANWCLNNEARVSIHVREQYAPRQRLVYMVED